MKYIVCKRLKYIKINFILSSKNKKIRKKYTYHDARIRTTINVCRRSKELLINNRSPPSRRTEYHGNDNIGDDDR